MSRVVHFEISANDPDFVKSFYETAFDWKFHKWDGPEPYWLITTGEDTEPGINGGMMRRMDPHQPMTNVIDVPSVDAYAERVQAAGGEIVVPRMAIPGVGWLAYFKDTEGNVFGMMQPDQAAA